MASAGRILRAGCIGCLGVAFLVLLAVAAIGLVAYTSVGNERVEERVLAGEELGAPGVTPTEAEPAVEPGAAPPPAAPVAGRGRLILELWHAEFRVEPARPGEPLRVEASYDTRSWELRQEDVPLTEGVDWARRIVFRRTGSGFVSIFKELLGGHDPEVTIFLPRDLPVELELAAHEGACEAELGGLHLTAAKLEVDKGALVLGFDEPLVEPLERLEIAASMGALETRYLGNASPRRFEADLSMGGMELDLRGAWLRDADISIRSRMAGAAVRVPKDVKIEGAPSGFRNLEPDGEIPRPTLRFDVTASSGEIEFY